MPDDNLKFKAGNLVLALGLLLLGFSILGASVYGQVATPGDKQARVTPVTDTTEEEDEQEEVLPVDDAVLPTPTPQPKVDYPLVYPGILPDHFLYPLKMIRDRVWLFLTTGSKRKAQVMLLFADKRLGAGKALIEGGKEGLGIATLTKGEKYLEQAVGQLQQAQQKEEDVGQLKETFAQAAAKHQEVLQGLKEKVVSDQWGVMDEMLRKTKALQVEIEKLP